MPSASSVVILGGGAVLRQTVNPCHILKNGEGFPKVGEGLPQAEISGNVGRLGRRHDGQANGQRRHRRGRHRCCH